MADKWAVGSKHEYRIFHNDDLSRIHDSRSILLCSIKSTVRCPLSTVQERGSCPMPDYSDFEYHRVQRIFYRSARNLALTAVVIAPWLFGSAEPWAYLFVCVISAASLGLFLLSKVCFPERRVMARALSVTLVLMLLMVLAQLITIPNFLARIFNPMTVEAGAVRDGLFRQMGVNEVLPEGFLNRQWSCISSVPMATHSALFLLVGYLGVFVVFSNAIRSWAHIKWITTTILVSSFIMVVLSLAHKFSGVAPEKIFWFHMPRYPGAVFGPFTNRNHFAFHLLMVFSMALALFCSSLPDIKKEWLSDWREQMAWIDSQLASQIVLIGFSLALFGAAIFISLSRGAVVSLLVATGLVWIILSRTKERSGGRLILWTTISLVLALTVWMGWEPVFSRLGSLVGVIKDPLSDTRAVITRDTMLLLKDFPVLGCGFGSFKHVFPIYQGMTLGSGIFLHAHNDWAQLFAEGGILCGCTFLVALMFFFRTICRHYPDAIRRARRYVMCLVFGIIAVMLHSFLDYSLHKPANAFLLSAMCGLAVATVHMSAVWDSDVDSDHEEGKHILRLWDLKARLIPLVVLVLLAILASMELSCLRRAVAFERFGYAERLIEKVEDPGVLNRTVQSALTEVDLIKSGDTCSPGMLREISADLVRWSLSEKIDIELRAQLAQKALQVSALSVYYAPTDYLGWLWLGRAQVVQGQWANGALCLERAKELRPYGLDVVLFEYN